MKDDKRKLAAIFSADAQGFSRLMGEDDSATVETLMRCRDVMGSIIAQHHGRLVDSPGDNLLADFSSAVHAVESAVEIQNALEKINLNLPKERRMPFRIGINLGDVIEKEGRLYGDGVNIAARLEALADAGGICISRQVYDQVKRKLPLEFEYMGEREVKNISEPVRVYRVVMAGTTVYQQESVTGREVSTEPIDDLSRQAQKYISRFTPDDFGKAVASLTQSIQSNPSNAWAHGALAYVYWEGFHQGWFQHLGVSFFDARLLAREHLNAAAEHSSVFMHIVLSEIHLYRRQFEIAMAEAEKAVAIEKDDPICAANLAYILITANRGAEAIDICEKALQRNPANAGSFYFRKGLAYFTLGRYAEAVELLEQAIIYNPKIHLYAAPLAGALVYR